ncbi:MAG: hypothetical protein HYR72_12195 [Deltaproteobacteria bacterium]|nr:hypothetical protein [Deltaproteobacteria bacterium]MBI3387785.1 hypothetical protein [Deltaproteobacteria bacterium]
MRWIVASGALCLAIFVATIPLPRVDGHLIGSDGFRYYAIVRSIVLDHDLDFTNDYQRLGVSIEPTATRLPANPFAIGSALLWLPFFCLAHTLSLLIAGLGVAIPVDGVGYLYESAVCIATIGYASAGFLLTYWLLRRLYDVTVALLATLAMWWATAAIYYTIAEPSMSHGLTIFSNALFLWMWSSPTRPRPRTWWFTLGLAGALVALVRWQEGVVLVVPIIELIVRIHRRQPSIADLAGNALALTAGFAIGFVPQMIMWATVYGTPLIIPQGSNFMLWASPHPLATLISSRHGMLSWHPVLLLAAFGIVPLWRRQRALALVAVGSFLVQLYVSSAAADWWAGDAFGGRRFTGLLPLFALSLAALLSASRQRMRTASWAVLLSLFVVWNGLCFTQYRLGLISRRDALTWQEMTIDRLLIPWTLVQKLRP